MPPRGAAIVAFVRSPAAAERDDPPPSGTCVRPRPPRNGGLAELTTELFYPADAATAQALQLSIGGEEGHA